MALPVLVSQIPGPSAYTDPSNAYIVPTLPGLRPDGFLEVNITAAVQSLRLLHSENRQNRWRSDSVSSRGGGDCSCTCKVISYKGRQARQKIREISPDHVVAMMVERIRSLANERGWDLELDDHA